MKVMEIEVLTRDGGDVLAVACPRSALLSEAGIGGGTTEREAVVQAVNSYFKRQEQAQAATRESLGLARDPMVRSSLGEGHAIRSSTVAIDTGQIRRLLNRACEAGTEVAISGTKVGGDRYTGRVVQPFAVQAPREFDTTEYLYCGTPEGNRMFRLDLIERAEDIPARPA